MVQRYQRMGRSQLNVSLIDNRYWTKSLVVCSCRDSSVQMTAEPRFLFTRYACRFPSFPRPQHIPPSGRKTVEGNENSRNSLIPVFSFLSFSMREPVGCRVHSLDVLSRVSVQQGSAQPRPNSFLFFLS